MENQYIGVELPKKEGLGKFANLRRGGGAWQKKGGGVFEGGLIPKRILSSHVKKASYTLFQYALSI